MPSNQLLTRRLNRSNLPNTGLPSPYFGGCVSKTTAPTLGRQ
jgi:hypothetical protein